MQSDWWSAVHWPELSPRLSALVPCKIVFCAVVSNLSGEVAEVALMSEAQELSWLRSLKRRRAPM